MKYLETNTMVADMVERQAQALATLQEAGVTPHLRIIRDQPGAESPEIRSYTASLRNHARLLLADRALRGSGLVLDDLARIDTVAPAHLPRAVRRVNADPAVTRAIVMSPAEYFDAAVADLDPGKDSDRMHPSWAQRQRDANGALDPYSSPATPLAVRKVIEEYDLVQPGTPVTLIGRGRTVGARVADDLLEMGADLTVITRRNGHLKEESIQRSRLVVAAVGSPVVSASMLEDQAVIGVGMLDIDPDVYTSDLPILVTPPHLQEEWGIGPETSALAWQDTIDASLVLSGLRFAVNAA